MGGGVCVCCGVGVGCAKPLPPSTMCRFRTPPCVHSKTSPFVPATRPHAQKKACGRVASARGDVLDAHTEAWDREEEGGRRAKEGEKKKRFSRAPQVHRKIPLDPAHLMTMTLTHSGKVIQQMSGDLARSPVEEESVKHVCLAEAKKTLVTLRKDSAQSQAGNVVNRRVL